MWHQACSSATTIVDQTPKQVPIKIERCGSKASLDYGGQLTNSVDYRNISGKIIVAERFGWSPVDAFGQHVQGFRWGDTTDLASPGVLIENRVHFTDSLSVWSDAQSVECGVLRVLFADGTTWRWSAADAKAAFEAKAAAAAK